MFELAQKKDYVYNLQQPRGFQLESMLSPTSVRNFNVFILFKSLKGSIYKIPQILNTQ